MDFFCAEAPAGGYEGYNSKSVGDSPDAPKAVDARADGIKAVGENDWAAVYIAPLEQYQHDGAPDVGIQGRSPDYKDQKTSSLAGAVDMSLITYRKKNVLTITEPPPSAGGPDPPDSPNCASSRTRKQNTDAVRNAAIQQKERNLRTLLKAGTQVEALEAGAHEQVTHDIVLKGLCVALVLCKYMMEERKVPQNAADVEGLSKPFRAKKATTTASPRPKGKTDEELRKKMQQTKKKEADRARNSERTRLLGELRKLFDQSTTLSALEITYDFLVSAKVLKDVPRLESSWRDDCESLMLKNQPSGFFDKM